MAKFLKWTAIGVAAVALLLIGVAVALQHWLRTDDFRVRVEREASAALGVPLQLGRLSVDLFPLPAVAADQVKIGVQPPLTVDRVEARPVWQALLQGRLEIATLLVRKAVLPQAGIAAIMVLPLALLVEHPWTLAMPNIKTWSALLALGLLSTAMAYAIYFWVLARAGATNTILVTFLIPVTALLLGKFRLHEALEWRQLGGMACIFVGLAIIDGRILRAIRGVRPTPKVEEVHA